MSELKKLFTITVISCLFVPNSYGQETDSQLWGDYNLTVPLTKNLTYGGDIGLRGFISNKDWNQVIIRPQIRYRWNQVFSVAGAVASFVTFNVEDDNVFEYRMHQEATINWPDLGFVALFYRVRLEQRFFFYQSDSLQNESNMRGRGLVGFETQDFRIGAGKRPFYFQGMWEGFQTAGEDSSYELFINQTRIHGVFGHRLSNLWRYEVQYIWQQSREYSEAGLETTQNVIRIRVFHRLPDRQTRRDERDNTQ